MPIISESTFQKFTLLKSKEVVIDYSCIGNPNECVFEMPSFAYPSDITDSYKNDFTSSLLALSNRYKNPEFYLEVLIDCNWVEVSQLNDSTYGTYYSTFSSNPNWAGFVVQWYKVYNVEGEGIYRIRQEYTDILDPIIKVNYSYRYNLKLYNANFADETTKINYTINGGKIGSTLNDEEVVDYKDIIWNREVRLPRSFFGFESSEYSREFTRYKNGGQEWVQDEQTETILYNCKRLPYSLHRELKITAMQSGELYVSDYNFSNPKLDGYNMKRVIPSSGYEPTWTTYTTFAPIQLTFEPYFKNLRRKRC
jgi:hypothetical protein